MTRTHVPRIEIAGGIASGKTTLARLLLYGLDVSFEDFRKNPFCAAFYANPAQYSFETELTFLLQHYHAIKNANAAGRTFGCDFSLLLDAAYADLNLRSPQRTAYQSVFKQVLKEVGHPYLLVYLRCGPKAELARIRKRGRAEEEALRFGYLSGLNRSLAHILTPTRKAVYVLSVDSERQNFAENTTVATSVAANVLSALHSRQKLMVLQSARSCSDRARARRPPSSA